MRSPLLIVIVGSLVLGASIMFFAGISVIVAGVVGGLGFAALVVFVAVS